MLLLLRFCLDFVVCCVVFVIAGVELGFWVAGNLAESLLVLILFIECSLFMLPIVFGVVVSLCRIWAE